MMWATRAVGQYQVAETRLDDAQIEFGLAPHHAQTLRWGRRSG